MKTQKRKVVSLWLGLAVVAILGIGSYAYSYSGTGPKVVVEGNYIESGDVAAADSFGSVRLDQDQFVVAPKFLDGVIQADNTFKVLSQGFANATSTLCVIQNTDKQSKNWWVTDAYGLITNPATTTVTFTYATSTTRFSDGVTVNTPPISTKVPTSTEMLVSSANTWLVNSTTFVPSEGSFELPYGQYLLFRGAAENSTLAGALNENTEALAGRCVVKYIIE